MPHYTCTVKHNDESIAVVESDRIDVAMSQGKASVPSGYPVHDLYYEMIDHHGGMTTGPLIAPVRFN